MSGCDCDFGHRVMANSSATEDHAEWQPGLAELAGWMHAPPDLDSGW